MPACPGLRRFLKEVGEALRRLGPQMERPLALQASEGLAGLLWRPPILNLGVERQIQLMLVNPDERKLSSDEIRKVEIG